MMAKYWLKMGYSELILNLGVGMVGWFVKNGKIFFPLLAIIHIIQILKNYRKNNILIGITLRMGWRWGWGWGWGGV